MNKAIFLFLLGIAVLARSDPEGPITKDFQTWLGQNGYGNLDFVRADLGTSGSYGGKASANETIKNEPVIFIHGNSDAALSYGFTATGWTNSITYFQSKGYKTAEMYATTWGDANPVNAGTRTHDCVILPRVRKFVEAVIAYTGASKVDIITHSMGVTIGRKILKGGTLQTNTGETCDLGKPLSGSVDTFVGLAGGNYGLCNCEGEDALISATCNQKNGFWPGDSCGFNTLDCGLSPLPFPCNGVIYSTFLTNLNADTTKEASYVYSAWSLLDDIVLYADQVWGRPTSLIPTSDGKKVYNTYTHMDTKDLTADDQYDMVVHHIISS
ncbi:hypothetical protein FO519_002849 [Halicephalobus sp. NKZ332]|nr:hypothetical protein FO519_002849 [Halicephalobus sp. NKZ332]